MKKILKFFPLLLIAVLGVALTSCDNDKDEPIPASKLPAKATEFITQYFPSANIVSSQKDKDKYEVYLSDGTDIDFDKDGEWIDVDAPAGKTIPTGFYPADIDIYITDYYSGVGINEISKEKRGFDVELTSGIDLIFASDGTFIGIDS